MSINFIASSIRNKWPSRIKDLLEVSLSIDDGLPQHIYSVCKKHLEVLERAAIDLVDFQARDAATSLSKRPPKRMQETSGSVGVSPDTARARPWTKRLSIQQLEFGNGMVV